MGSVNEIIIYGSGQRGSGLYTLLRNCDINVKYVIDTNEKKWDSPFYDIKISAPEVLLQDSKTPICIAIAKEEDAASVREQLSREYAVGEEREIKYFDLIKNLYQMDENIQNALSEEVPLGCPKILFECDYGLGLGGIEAWTKSICKELIRDGWENIRIMSDSGDYGIPSVLHDKVTMLPINHDEMFGSETIAAIIHFLLRQMPCVVVTGQFYVTLLAACLVRQRYPDQLRIVSVIHFGKEELYRQYASVDAYVDLFISVSREIADGLTKCGVEKSKIDHMTCPVQCDKVLERTYCIDSSQPVRLGFAGRVNAKQKRMDLVPQLVGELEARKVNYCLEIAGEGDYCGKLKTFIGSSGLEDRVRLLGRLEREEIGDFWKAQDVCLSLSDYEGRSISIMEAMANGAVPVVTATSGVREDIADGENGYIVEIQDIPAMAERIALLDCHRDQMSIMGKKAHDDIFPKCQMREHLHYWEEILDEKIKGVGQGRYEINTKTKL